MIKTRKFFLAISTFLALGIIFAVPQHALAFNGKDINNDGKVSLEEFLAAPTKRFQEKDKNNDGFLSESEMRPPAAKAAPISAERKAKIQKRRQERKRQRELEQTQ